MPVLNKQTGIYELTPKEIAKQQAKQTFKDKYKGKDKTKLTNAEMMDIVVRMAQDQGYLD